MESVCLRRFKYLFLYSILAFSILITVKLVHSYHNIDNFKKYDYEEKSRDLKILINNMNKVSDSIFNNVINTPEIINIFKNAHNSSEIKQKQIRDTLYSKLKNKYSNLKNYGIQQLHFHLPNNDSFLRFHKPNKYGDNLTKIRESVKYVNAHKKPISGFEEGKIFNGYRYVYPLFDKNNIHLGSVEISSSLLNFKKTYEDIKNKHIDFILKKDIVQKKVFSSELSNYREYSPLENFVIQTPIYEFNQANSSCNTEQNLFTLISNDKELMRKINNIQELYILKFYNFKVYSIVLVPLLNNFTKEKVGYTVFFNNPIYFEEYFVLESVNMFMLLILSISIGFMTQFYKKKSLLEDEIDKQNKKLLKAQHISKMGFWELDVINNKLYWSDEIFEIFEIDKNKFEASYNGFLNVIHPSDRDMVNGAYSNSLKTKEDYTIEHRLLMDDGRVKWVKEECSTDFNKEGNPLISVGVVMDITELHSAQQKLIQQTYIDDMTKLNNRKSFNENVCKLLSSYQRYKTPFCMIMYDIDNFKNINDTYGHNIGDDILIKMSKLVKSLIRESDYIFRLGGEEFAVLLTETQLDKASIVAEKIRKYIENEVKINNDEKITVSIGLTQVDENDTKDIIYKRADELLYKSKHNGKNTISC